MNFKIWLNEYQSPGLLKGLLRGTCGERSCSRGSGKGYDPQLDGVNDARSSNNLLSIKFKISPEIDLFYNISSSSLMVSLRGQTVDNQPSNNMVELIQKVNQKVYTNQSQILSFINDYYQKQNNSNANSKQYSMLKYTKSYVAKDSRIFEYELKEK